MLQKLKNQKGFTLVELIVVIAVLGVVGSFAVPALTGYADTAKENQAVSETQACVMTATTLAAKQRAASTVGTKSSKTSFEIWAGGLETAAPALAGGDLALTEGSGQYYLNVSGYTGSEKTNADAMKSIEQTAEVTGKVGAVWFNSAGKVLYLLYTSKDGITVAYTATGTTTSYDNTIPPATIPGQEDETPTNPTTPSTPGDTGSSDDSDDVAWGNNSLLIHMDTGSTAQISGGTYTIVDKSGNVIGTDFTLDANGNLVCSDSKTPIKIVKNPNDGPPPKYGTLYSGEEYTIIETEAPAGYQSLYVFTVKLFINQDGDIISGVMDTNENKGVWNADTLSFSIPRYPVLSAKIYFVDSNKNPVTGGAYTITDTTDNRIVLENYTASGGSITFQVNDVWTDSKTCDDGVTDLYLTTGHHYEIKQVTAPSGTTGSWYDDGGETTTVKFSVAHQSQRIAQMASEQGDNCVTAQYNALYVTYGTIAYSLEETTCTVTIKTVDSDKVAISGATLTLTGSLYADTDNGWSVSTYNNTLNQWNVQNEEKSQWQVTLEPGTYLITETTAPDGYVMANPKTFVIDPGETSKTITITHEKKETVDFTVNAVYVAYADKDDKDNAEKQTPLTGVQLALYASDPNNTFNSTGAAIKTWNTDDSASYTVNGLAPGVYILEVKQNPNNNYNYLPSGIDPGWDNSQSGYTLRVIVDKDNTSYTVIGIVKEGYCAVTIKKVDSSGNLISVSGSGAKLKLTTYNDADNLYNNTTTEWYANGTSKTVFVEKAKPLFKLSEEETPTGYLKALPITFTVGTDETAKTIEMVDYTADDNDKNIAVSINSNGYTLAFSDKDSAVNWAHKLTTNDDIRYSSGDLLYWNGELYYTYNKYNSGKENTNINDTKYYLTDDKEIDYTALANAPDPITLLNNYITKNNTGDNTGNYIVKLTGTVYEVKNVSRDYKIGDIVVYNGTAYVFRGTSWNGQSPYGTAWNTTFSEEIFETESKAKSNGFYKMSSTTITGNS